MSIIIANRIVLELKDSYFSNKISEKRYGKQDFNYISAFAGAVKLEVSITDSMAYSKTILIGCSCQSTDGALSRLLVLELDTETETITGLSVNSELCFNLEMAGRAVKELKSLIQESNSLSKAANKTNWFWDRFNHLMQNDICTDPPP